MVKAVLLLCPYQGHPIRRRLVATWRGHSSPSSHPHCSSAFFAQIVAIFGREVFWPQEGHQATSVASQFQHPTNVKCLGVFPSLQLLDNATLQQVLHLSWPHKWDAETGWIFFVASSRGIWELLLFNICSMCLQNPKQGFITLRWKSSTWREVLEKNTENNPWQGLNSSESMISHPLRSCQDNLDFHANPRALKIQHRKKIGGNRNKTLSVVKYFGSFKFWFKTFPHIFNLQPLLASFLHFSRPLGPPSTAN